MIWLAAIAVCTLLLVLCEVGFTAVKPIDFTVNVAVVYFSSSPWSFVKMDFTVDKNIAAAVCEWVALFR